MTRLDYFLVPLATLSSVLRCEIILGYLSDHCFVELELKIAINIRGPGLWKMNTSLLNDKSYVEKLNAIIKESEVRLAHQDTSNPAAAWEYLKYEIQRFSITYSKEKAQMRRNKVSMLTSKLASLEKRLACINLKSDSAVRTIQLINQKIDNVKAELNTELRYITQGAILRSKVRWYTEAEHSTKYFFALEKNRSRNKQIGSTRTQDGKITHDRKQILNEQNRFYQQLYSSNQSVKFVYKNTQGPTISHDQKFELGKEITLEEISTAIKEMPRNKTPGADGISANFYKMFFVKLKWMLLELFRYCFKVGNLNYSARRGIITLIPKKGCDLLLIKELASNYLTVL